ncbi:39S ribosomal protein L33, mitochondrial [Acipenser ruthenus]|uniref:39S ribosomal protein L33, mitochondrial n=1 Tax=Acipenser ruthenus TaxID=7906 RepID=A0A444U587_ACIRT|nr:39S ribosomal protein L33, mitochondrial [Acipenser ruthenus]
MMSAAGTGYSFNTKRNRLREKLVLRKHDPKGEEGGALGMGDGDGQGRTD